MAQIATFYDHIKDIAAQENISFAEAMQEARSLGVELLEISQNNLLGREEEVEKELAAAGMGISSIPAYFNFGVDKDVDRQSLPTLEAARRLGAAKMLVIPGFFQPEDDEESRTRQSNKIARCLVQLAEKAQSFGVSLVMEDYDNRQSPCATAQQVRFFVDRCPGLLSCFDTGNFRFSAQDELEAYDLLKDKIGHVHLKDRSYTCLNGESALMALDGRALYPCPVGAGDLNLAQLVARLKEDGYNGAYTIEHYGAGSMLATLRSSVAWVKDHI